MLFQNPTILLCLTDKSLRIISPSQDIDKLLIFPEGLVKHGEITNQEELKEVIGKFLEDNPLKGKGILMLSKELVFKENAELGKKNQNQIKKFLEYIPLKPDSVGKLIIKKDNTQELFATNKKIYNAVKQVAESNHIEIPYITPINAFTEIYLPEKLSPADVEDILKNTQTIETYNFLSNNPSDDSKEKMTEDKNKPIHYIVFSISLISTIIAVIFILLEFRIIPNPFTDYFAKKEVVQSTTTTTTTKPTIPPAPSPSPTIDKKSIKIQILNGSGISGQAKTTSDAITVLGYNNITTGNATDSTASATIILYKKSVPKTIVDEINGALKKLYTAVTPQETIQSDFDISIITGR